MVAQRSGHFWRVGDAIAIFVQMGCELRVLPGEIQRPSGGSFTVRFLFNPDTNGFVEIIDLDDNEQISMEEIEYWERRLGMDIPKGSNIN
jgi:hypothetical protein